MFSCISHFAILSVRNSVNSKFCVNAVTFRNKPAVYNEGPLENRALIRARVLGSARATYPERRSPLIAPDIHPKQLKGRTSVRWLAPC